MYKYTYNTSLKQILTFPDILSTISIETDLNRSCKVIKFTLTNKFLVDLQGAR